MKNTVIVHYHSQHGNYFDYSCGNGLTFMKEQTVNSQDLIVLA